MDNILEQLITPSAIIFCLIVAIIVEIKNRLISYFWPMVKNNKLYRELILPISPILIGGLLAGLVSSYPFPEAFSTLWARVALGAVGGLASAHVYRIARQFIVKKDETNLPPTV